VTPTNTGAPTVTPTTTGTAISYAPTESESAIAQQQITPQPSEQSVPLLAVQQLESQSAPQQIAALQPLPTPTVLLIVNRQVIPDNCIELIDNGSFEARGMGWGHDGGKILPVYAAPTVVPGTPSSGLAIRLGLVDKIEVAGVSAAQQLVPLPKESNKITLRFRYFPRYDVPPSRGDFQYVDIYHGESGQFVGRALGVQRNDRTWIEREYDLSALAGESVRLFFMVSNDGVGGNIAMYVDDVSILACRVPKLQPQNRLAVGRPAQQSVGSASTPQPLTLASANDIGDTDRDNIDTGNTDAQAEIVPVQGFSFGRLGGLLAVLGIAGAALVLLPLTRRFTK
jgi:hypothetical protein